MSNGPNNPTMSDTGVTQETSDQEAGLSLDMVTVAAGAGLGGMIAMTPILVVGILLGVLSPSAFAGLAEIVMLGDSFAIGSFIFIAGGMTSLPLLFVSLAVFLPGSTLARRGVTYATIVWTGFIIAFYTQQTGTALAGYLVITLVAHWAYGYVLGLLYDRYAAIPQYDV
ncbi:hypothetical protein AUR64_18355 [Haloprofundus marisrubri]|uniref:Cytochrome C oxidase subunit I n=1 Tax=Haloprofundus marisrubri TaxID=1514971 RepID=A0A0W1R5N4_9EURY|nr:DUF6789 family protein [Haloprofundus marisrubri]KTG08628.1 hypothetical protein AUR64_18355 [Haloprofundus marisrubri]